MLQLVDQAARRPYDHVRNFIQLTRLGHHVHPTNDDACAQIQVLPAEGFELLVYLIGKLAGRSHNHGKDAVRVLGKFL